SGVGRLRVDGEGRGAAARVRVVARVARVVDAPRAGRELDRDRAVLEQLRLRGHGRLRVDVVAVGRAVQELGPGVRARAAGAVEDDPAVHQIEVVGAGAAEQDLVAVDAGQRPAGLDAGERDVDVRPREQRLEADRLAGERR